VGFRLAEIISWGSTEAARVRGVALDPLVGVENAHRRYHFKV
jgi:hypothetical protein